MEPAPSRWWKKVVISPGFEDLLLSAFDTHTAACILQELHPPPKAVSARGGNRMLDPAEPLAPFVIGNKRYTKRSTSSLRSKLRPPPPPAGWWHELTAAERRRLPTQERDDLVRWWQYATRTTPYRAYLARFFTEDEAIAMAPTPRRVNFPSKLRRQRWWKATLWHDDFRDYLIRHFGEWEGRCILDALRTPLPPAQHRPRRKLPRKPKATLSGCLEAFQPMPRERRPAERPVNEKKQVRRKMRQAAKRHREKEYEAGYALPMPTLVPEAKPKLSATLQQAARAAQLNEARAAGRAGLL